MIAADGRVLADNQGNPATMDNHSGRPEVQEAQRTGTGVSVRFSHTVEKNELYLAYRLEATPRARFCGSHFLCRKSPRDSVRRSRVSC